MRYEYLIFTVLFAIVFSSTINSTDAITYTPKLVKTHEGIVDISKIPISTPEPLSIEIVNIGNGSAHFVNYVFTDLRLTDEHSFSNLDMFISKNNITSKTILPLTLPPQQSALFTWTVNSTITDEGTYTGKIFLNDSKSEIIPIDVSVTYRASPWDMLLYSFSGLVIAVIIGSSYEFYEKRYKSKKVLDETYLTVYKTMFEVVKFILIYLDEPKKSLPHDYWLAYQEWIGKNIQELENEMRNLTLSETSTAYLAFKKLLDIFIANTEKKSRLVIKDENRIPVPYPMYAQLRQHMLDNNLEDVNSINLHVSKFPKLEKIKFIDGVIGPPSRKNYDDRLISATKSTKPTHKILYFLATSIISSVSAFFVVDSFIGPYFLNGAVAFALGFGIYRSKDFTKLFASEEKK